MAAVGQLQATADVDTRQEQEDAFCELMRFIREDPEACELTETDPRFSLRFSSKVDSPVRGECQGSMDSD